MSNDNREQPIGVAVPAPRLIWQIADEIRQDWKKIYFGAVPYLQAMHTLDTLQDKYGADDAQGIVLYFLSNATHWHGETARRVKKELREMVKNTKMKSPYRGGPLDQRGDSVR